MEVVGSGLQGAACILHEDVLGSVATLAVSEVRGELGSWELNMNRFLLLKYCHYRCFPPGRDETGAGRGEGLHHGLSGQGCQMAGGEYGASGG